MPVSNIPVIGYPDYTPYTQITPFTVRDGATYLLTLEALKDWIRDVLVPAIDTNMGDLQTEWQTQVNALVDEINTAITQITDSVNTAIDGNQTEVDQKVADLTAYVNTQVASIIGSTIAVSDPVVNGVLLAAGSVSKQTTDRFAFDRIASGHLIPKEPIRPAPNVIYDYAVGASVAAVYNGGTGYAVNDTVTLAGTAGPNDIPTILTVASISTGGVITSVTVNRAGIYAAAPANPVAVTSSSGAGTGALFTVTWSGTPSSFATGTFTQVVPNDSTKVKFTGNGPGNVGGSGGYGNASGNATATTFEFDCDAPYIELRFVAFTTQMQLFIDGKRISYTKMTNDASARYQILRIDFGTQRQLRSFKLFGANNAFAHIRYSSTISAVIRPPAKIRKLAWLLGDSYAFGNGTNDIAMAACNVMGEAIGLDVLPDGVSGAGWTGSTVGTPAQRITAKFATLTQTPDYVIFDMGYNNSANTSADITTGFNAAVDQIRVTNATVPIYVFGPATPQGETTGLATVKAALSAAAAAKGCTFIDVANWVDSSNSAKYTGGDGIHPTPLGHVYLGIRKAAALNNYLQIV